MWAICLFLLALAAGTSFRLFDLEVRPMHTDETTQAIKFRDLTQGQYLYDPTEHHGPTLLYATYPSVWRSGATSFADLTERDLRLVPAAFGLMLLVLLPLVRTGLGWMAVGWAAVFLAVSPSFVFFSRYYIMEMLLVFFSFTTIVGGYRFYLTRNSFWLGVCAVSLACMHATKETFIIHVIGMLGALVAIWVLRLMTGGLGVLQRNRPEPITKKHWIFFAGLVVFTSALLFSQGFQHLHSIGDSIGTYFNYADRAGGQGHQKPWYYYLQLLGYNTGGKFWLGQSDGTFVWSELLILLLAVLGIVRAFVGQGRGYDREFALFLGVYAVLTFGAYSFISYKTPWCILSTHLALVLLAGFGAAGIFNSLFTSAGKWALTAALTLGAGHLALQSYRATAANDPTDPRWLQTRNAHSLGANPYAYGFTPTGLRDNIVSKLNGYASRSPLGHGLRMEIATPGGPWPLPWYLRKFTATAYLPDVDPTPGFRGLDTTADVILVDPSLLKKLPESIRGPDFNGSADYTKDIFGLLNQQYWIQGYVRNNLLEIPPPPPPFPAPAPAPESAPVPAQEPPTEAPSELETPVPPADVPPVDPPAEDPEPPDPGSPDAPP